MAGERVSRFPCDCVPEDIAQAKLVGIHKQRQDGFWMQRVKIPGGILTGVQWRGLGRIAREITPGTPLHLTTRQDVEIHNLTDDRVAAAQRIINGVGLSCVGAGGDSLRNITLCSCNGVAEGSVCLMRFAKVIEDALKREEGIFSLPRKFKINIACSDECGQPWINDLGLVVRYKDGRLGFRVIGAGSLGHRPAVGIGLVEWIDVVDVIPLVVAVIRVFAEHGDRDHRGEARLRHVRQRIGDEVFKRLVLDRFARVKAQRVWPVVELSEVSEGYAGKVELNFANGDLTADQADVLGRLADEDEICVRISNFHSVIVYGKNRGVVLKKIAEHEVLAEAASLRVSVVACPGVRWCGSGLVDMEKMADQIRDQLGEKLGTVRVGISGCPNGCAQSAVANIGLVGSVISKGGVKGDGFDVFYGGDGGCEGEMGELVSRKIASQDVVKVIGSLVGQ